MGCVTHKRLFRLALIIGLSGLVSPKLALSAQCSQVQSDEADRLFESAVKKLKAKSYQDGLALLKQAIGKCPQTNYLKIVPKVYVRLAQHCDAQDAFDGYLNACGETTCAPQDIATATKGREAAEAKCSPVPKTLEAGAAPEARQLYKQGRDAFVKGDYQGASAQFERALIHASDSPILNRSQARTLDRMGAFEKAIDAYEKYLKVDPDADDRGRVENIIKYLKRKSQENWPTITFESVPGNARILSKDEDRNTFGETPFAIQLPPGRYTVLVYKDGYETKEHTFLVQAKTPATVSVTLTKPKVAPKTNWTRVSAWSSIGLGVAVAGLGAYFHSATFTTADDMKSVGPSPREDQRFRSLEDRFDREQLSATISYSAGAALIGTGIVLFLMDSKSPDGVVWHGNGVTASWTF